VAVRADKVEEVREVVVALAAEAWVVGARVAVVGVQVVVAVVGWVEVVKAVAVIAQGAVVAAARVAAARVAAARVAAARVAAARVAAVGSLEAAARAAAAVGSLAAAARVAAEAVVAVDPAAAAGAVNQILNFSGAPSHGGAPFFTASRSCERTCAR
jgi:hypothetical protein